MRKEKENKKEKERVKWVKAFFTKQPAVGMLLLMTLPWVVIILVNMPK